MTALSAAAVAACLPAHDLTSEWSDTGGGVFNLEVPLQDYSGSCSDVFAYIALSDNGEWMRGDYAAPAECVSVILYDAFTGDPFDPAAWLPVHPLTGADAIYASTVDDALALILAAEQHARACFSYDSDGGFGTAGA